MKLLFDENLSPKLPQALSAEYPGSEHVRTVGLLGAEDQRIWDYSREHGYTIVSKDTDFRERSFVRGFPPKVIWLDVANSGTSVIIELLQRERNVIEAFENEDASSFLILSLDGRSL